jgi:peptide/nickel transport system permease protein
VAWCAGNYVVRRSLGALVLSLVAVSAVFWMVHLIPGDPAINILGGGDQSPSKESVDAVRRQLGLDRPVLFQYAGFLRKLSQLDLGASFVSKQPVVNELAVRIPRTLLLVFPAMIIAIVVGFPLGVLAAARRGSLSDTLVTFVTTLFFAVPVFVYALLLGTVFSVYLGWLPVGRYVNPLDSLSGYLLRSLVPVISLSLLPMAVIMRTTRAAMVEQLTAEYVKTAWSKGLTFTRILWRHIARNALLPVLTATGLQFGQLLAASVLVEFIFNWPGVNLYLLQAIARRDYPAIQGVVLFVAVSFIVINLATDLAYGMIDPRVRRATKGKAS